MAKKDEAPKEVSPGDAPAPVVDAVTPEQQAQEQTGQQVRVRVDDREMKSSYANGFVMNATADEVMVGFGINVVRPTPGQQEQAEILFTIGDRIVMGYPTAKRLAIQLSQTIRRHEQQFGEVELDPQKRRVDQK